jgi:hypothetical protein
MNTMFKGVLAALAAVITAGAAAATTVTFVEPEKFSDVPFSTIERDRVLAELRGHFEKLGARLPAGQDLHVEVLDVDLAGITRPTSTRPDLRILNGGADWPRVQLRYRVEQGGQVLKSGEENLSDMTYMQHINPYTADTSLRYEKQMIDTWFRKKVLAG